jgi:uncharacterized repeat protein (TIGR03806 family)
MKTAYFITGLWMTFYLFAFLTPEPRSVKREQFLSNYKFFTGDIDDLHPSEDVIPYAVNTPLFSNYSEKLRFIRLPEGETIRYNDSSVFALPVGTVLIKNFYYPIDFRKPHLGRKIIETRLLVHQPEGWEAWPYVWNASQTDAEYDPVGSVVDVTYTNASGKRVSTPYVVPNRNQCKGCHIRSNAIQPIGVTARQLNVVAEGKSNQLQHWVEKSIIQGVPASDKIKTLAVWDDPQTGDLNSRARSYLDANCGHCHSSSGPANTSGLYLDFFESRKSHLGVNKSPVAAGRGSGSLRYDIVPGHPNQSILLYRMKTNDPAIAMPEIGREQIHEEGVALIEEWIRKNSF